jgi:hypothetical protein
MNMETNLPPNHPRKAVRQKSFLRGSINFNNARSTLDCLIRDISLDGARLDFSGTVSTPDVFDLYIPQKEQVICANVAWRHGEEVGVAFAQPSAMDQLGEAEADDLARRLARLEAQVGTLKRACKKLRFPVRL